MSFEIILESADMRLERAGSIGLHVGPLRFSSKINQNMDEKRDIFQEVLFERLSSQSEVNGLPKVRQGGPREPNEAPMASQGHPKSSLLQPFGGNCSNLGPSFSAHVTV